MDLNWPYIRYSEDIQDIVGRGVSSAIIFRYHLCEILLALQYITTLQLARNCSHFNNTDLKPIQSNKDNNQGRKEMN